MENSRVWWTWASILSPGKLVNLCISVAKWRRTKYSFNQTVLMVLQALCGAKGEQNRTLPEGHRHRIRQWRQGSPHNGVGAQRGESVTRLLKAVGGKLMRLREGVCVWTPCVRKALVEPSVRRGLGRGWERAWGTDATGWKKFRGLGLRGGEHGHRP